MNTESLLELICDEFGLVKDEVSEDTLLEEIVSDEFEMNQLIETINDTFDTVINAEPDGESDAAPAEKASEVPEVTDAVTEELPPDSFSLIVLLDKLLP